MAQQRSAVLDWKRYLILWHLAPPLFSALTWAFSECIRSMKRRRESLSDTKEGELAPEPEYFERYSPTDVPMLQRAYKYAFAIQGTMHVATLVYSCCCADFALVTAFPTSKASLSQLGSRAVTFITVDQVFATIATLASNLYTVWDLRRLGYVKTQEAYKAAAGVILGCWSVPAQLGPDYGIGGRRYYPAWDGKTLQLAPRKASLVWMNY